jgi:hypothetical protein
MNSQDTLTQLTFYYSSGQTKSFNVLNRANDSVMLQLQQEIWHL